MKFHPLRLQIPHSERSCCNFLSWGLQAGFNQSIDESRAIVSVIEADLLV